MKPSEALELHREAIRRAVNRYGLCNPRVFGSAARGDDAETSDLDLLVDLGPRTTLFDLGGLSEELKDFRRASRNAAEAGDRHAQPHRARISRT